jgi:O-glycosyl hydrolase
MSADGRSGVLGKRILTVRRHVVFVAALLLGTILASAGMGDVTATIDPATRFQTIDNFGASGAWTLQSLGGWSEAGKRKIADLLFSRTSGIGLSCWRFNVGGGIQHKTIANPIRSEETFEIGRDQYDWNRQWAEQWFLAAAKARGVEQFLAFVNSPPGRMTLNGLTNMGSNKTAPSNLKPGYEGQYAKYLADILLHFRDSGAVNDSHSRIDFDYVSPVNEPGVDWQNGQEGCRMDNEGATRRYRAKFGNYIDYFTSIPGMGEMLGYRLCHHLYGSSYGRGLDFETKAIGHAMAGHTDWKMWMSEICIMQPKRDLTMKSGIELAKMIHACMANENASAWQWWLAVSNADFKDGLLYTDWHKPGDPENVIESKMLWAMGNYSRFIRPNWQRIAIRDDAAHPPLPPDPRLSGHYLPQTRPAISEGMLGTAFIDPAGRQIAIVYINDGAEEHLHVQFAGSALPTSMMMYVTSDTESLGVHGPLNAGDTIDVPAHSVVTLLANRG